MKDMGYKNAFIKVAADCPTDRGVVPQVRGDHKPIHVLQYELLAAHPYRYTHADLLYEVHVRHKELSAAECRANGREIREALLAKPHPCLRASLLPKKYGWGVHYDSEGRIAIYPRESEDYAQFTGPGGIANLVPAMRNKRATGAE